MVVKYKLKSVLKKRGSKFLKLLFVIILCALTYCLLFYINESYAKFKIKPEILISEKYINRHEIPFPAITICPPQVLKTEYLNMTKIKTKISQGKTPNVEDLAMLAVSGYACFSNLLLIEQFHYRNKTDSKSKDYNEDVVQIMKKISPRMDDVLDTCQTSKERKCSNLFINTLTYRGSCFTFNMLDHNLIFRNGISKDLPITKTDPYSNQKPMWTLEHKYSTRDTVKPLRPTDVASLYVKMRHNKSEASNLCPERNRGHSVAFHLPNEYPSFMHTFTNFETKKQKFISITAAASKYDDFLKTFPLDQRGCYNEDERQLRFFRQYTMINCLQECIANFSIKKCGCAAYDLPRSDEMRVCRYVDNFCFKEININWPAIYYKGSQNRTDNPDLPCNCMPTCSNLVYSEINDYTFDVDEFDSKNFTYGSIAIHFTFAQIVETTKCATFHFHNFIAEVGGFLSLFLGFSLLSILELTFGCIVNTRTALNYIINMISLRWLQNTAQNVTNNNVIIVVPGDERKTVIISEPDQQEGQTECQDIHNLQV